VIVGNIFVLQARHPWLSGLFLALEADPAPFRCRQDANHVDLLTCRRGAGH
jgi:hypothetical protein